MMKRKSAYKRDRNNIPGVYNYCNRWCEKCMFTNRCAVYKFDPESFDDDETNEVDEYVDPIQKVRDDVSKAVTEAWQAEEDFDFNFEIDPEEMKKYEERSKRVDELMEKDELSKLTMQYVKGVKFFMKEHPEFLEAESAHLVGGLKARTISGEYATKRIEMISEATETIHFYELFIHIKFQRALHGLYDDDGFEEDEGYQKDSDGSAKVALIAVDSCINAWTTLKNEIDWKADHITPVVKLLENIREVAETKFPNARNFVRPGFDTEIVISTSQV